MTAIDTLLVGLFDYAGLYPPASLGLRSAANNYLEYSRSQHAAALGRFIINRDRLDEFRSILGDSLERFRISIVATEDTDLDGLTEQIRTGMPIETLELKCADASEIKRIASRISNQLTTYFEVPLDSSAKALLKIISDGGARAKIRMGGVIPQAFPSVPDVVRMLTTLAELGLPFKATAGLHHPVRSLRPLTYQPQAPTGMMYGFMNLYCAAAVVYFGGEASDAQKALEDEDPSAWQVSADALQWRHLQWGADQLATLRRDFFISIGSCSFEEPMRDLESLGWL